MFSRLCINLVFELQDCLLAPVVLPVSKSILLFTWTLSIIATISVYQYKGQLQQSHPVKSRLCLSDISVILHLIDTQTHGNYCTWKRTYLPTTRVRGCSLKIICYWQQLLWLTMLTVHYDTILLSLIHI